MTPSSTDELLDALERTTLACATPPWGMMYALNVADRDLTIKSIFVDNLARTSLQYHERKDELLVVLDNFGRGYVTVEGINVYEGGSIIRISPWVVHRVVGPIRYLEISTYDDDTDTVRLEDDYGRVA